MKQRRRFQPKVEDAVTVFVLILAVPALVMIGSVIGMIVKVCTGGVLFQ